MPKIDLDKVPVKTGSSYPEPYHSEMAGRSSLRLADFAGLSQFGASIVILAPGGKSSMRHWHMLEDELLIVTQGVCTLVDDTGETPLNVGDVAAFPAGEENGHHLVNNTDKEARFLVVGTSDPNETAYYSDIDMMVTTKDHVATFTRKDGSKI